MIEKGTQPLLITSEEAVEICRKASTVESIYRAQDIESAYREHISVWEETDITWLRLCTLAAIYDAGRIQGIREERLKKKNRKQA